MPFNFALLMVPWAPAAIAEMIGLDEQVLPDGACPSWVLGNHDERRVASWTGAEQARGQ